MGAGVGRKRGVREGFMEEVTFVLSLERSWHWDRQRWGRRGLAQVAGLQNNAKFCFCHRLSFPPIHRQLRHQIFKQTRRPGSSSTAS